jgi:hypothetical protein
MSPVSPLHPDLLFDQDELPEYMKVWVPRLSVRRVEHVRRTLMERRGVSGELFDRLFSLFVTRQVSASIKPAHRGDGFERWITDVLAIRVELKAGGRAILEHPKRSYRVEIQWHQTGKDERGKPTLEPKSIHVIADRSLGYPLTDGLDIYQAAFLAAMIRGSGRGSRRAFHRAPTTRPAPGQPFNTDFYLRVLALYNDLVREGRKDPAKEIARRYDAKHSTVKSWLSRGRRYLEEGEEK